MKTLPRTLRSPRSGVLIGRSVFWPPAAVLFVIVVASELLGGRYRFIPPPFAETLIAFGAMLAVYAFIEEKRARVDHAMAATVLLVFVVTVVEVWGIVNLLGLLLSNNGNLHGTHLLASGAYYWTSNVLTFGLWYWIVDRGGPQMRAEGVAKRPDFFFPEMAAGPDFDDGWVPDVVSYMYLSFTNATAFSPTDTLPLSSRARLLMTVEAVLSLVTIALVAARAVNILK